MAIGDIDIRVAIGAICRIIRYVVLEMHPADLTHL